MWFRVDFDILPGVSTFLYIKANSQYELELAIAKIQYVNNWQMSNMILLQSAPLGYF